MAKITIPTQQRVKLELEMDLGELILMMRDSQKADKLDSLIMGVFSKFGKDAESKYPQVILEPAFRLYSCYNLGGISIPIVSKNYSPKEAGGPSMAIISAYSRNDFFVGQDEIVKLLYSLNGFEPHAEWVSRLRKPYLE